MIVLLIAHLCSRLALHRTSLSGGHNFDRVYAVSLSLMAGRGFNDLAVDESAASTPLREFFELRRSRISREEFETYLASTPDPARDPKYQWYLPLATTRVADVRLAALLWRVFGIDRGVLATFYSLFSVATCAALFFIGRRLTGSGWAGLAAAALLTVSPIEGFLNTWSWRDASPMWFTALALAWFVCGLERCQRPAMNLLSYLVLGALAVLGIGWRLDALLVAPFLAGAILVQLIVGRVGWKYLALAMGCFAAGGVGVRSAIVALGPSQRQTANIGFHMAFYSDYSRSKLLGIEDSFAVQFSDANTLDVARQMYRADHPTHDILPYLSPEYGDVCRRMFLEELNYNVFRWVSGLPKFYVRALSGLDSPTAIGEVGSRQIQMDLRSPLRQCLSCGDWLEHAMPLLFLIGVLATTCAGPRRLPALLVALFSAYYAGIMFLVLPDQKHLGVLLVPLYVFAGAGLWGAARLSSPRTWSAEARVEWRRGIWRVGTVVLVAAAAWGLTCAWARGQSTVRREELLNEIQTRAARGADAPETLRGDRNFTVAMRPDSSAEAAGYRLTISAGNNPGVLVCRQVYFPRDWANIWGRELITRHPLYPNREQSFFVSCLPGARIGDPCPQLYTVAIEGEGRILHSTRVALSDWHHPPIGTLYYEGQRSPGSPKGERFSTEWLYAGARPFADPYSDPVKSARSGMAEKLAAQFIPPATGRPLRHIIAHSTDTGTWTIAMSDGWRIHIVDLNYWSPTAKWLQLQPGDFNGDGLFDLIGQAPDGQWWLATANGGFHEFRLIDSLPREGRYDFVGVGDFNGDGLDDLILRSTDGHWTLARSNGSGFQCEAIDGLPSGTLPAHILIGDFLGNGRSQIAGLDPRSGRWTIASMEASKWSVRPWGDFPPGVDWRHLIVGDFCGTGQADVAAWDPATGGWTVGHNENDHLVAKSFGNWPVGKTWKCVQSGRFGDGRFSGLVAIDGSSGELLIATSDGSKFTTRRYVRHAAFADHFFVGAFSGGARDDLLGIAADGQLSVGKLDANGELRFEPWGRWPDANRLTDFTAVGFWPERGPGR